MITDILSQEWNNERLGDIQDALQALLNQMVTDIDGVKSKKVTDINLSTEGTTLTATVTFSDETEASASVDIQDALNAADIAVDIVNNLRTDNPSKALSASMGMELNRKACVLLEHMHLAADTMLTDSDLELNEQRLFFVPTLNRIYAFDCHAIGSGLVNREVTRDVYPPRFGVVYYDLETATAWRWDGTNMVLAVHPPYFMIVDSTSGTIENYNPLVITGDVYPRLVWFSALSKLVYLYMDGQTRRHVDFDPDPNRVYVRLGSSPKVVQWSGSEWVNVIDISLKANAADVYSKSQVDTMVGGKQDALTFDDVPTAGHTTQVMSSDKIKTAIDQVTPTIDANGKWVIGGVTTNHDAHGPMGNTTIEDGEDMVALIVNDLTTGGQANFLSAEMGKALLSVILQIFGNLGEYAFPNGKPTLNFNTQISFHISYSQSDQHVTYADGQGNTAPSTVELLGRLEIQLGTDDDLYVINESAVKVFVGGTEVSGAYDPTTDKIIIPEVYGNVVIIAESMTYEQSGLVLHLDCRHRGGTGTEVSGHWKSLVNYGQSPIDFTLGSAVVAADTGMVFDGTSNSYAETDTALNVMATDGTIEVVAVIVDSESNNHFNPVLVNPIENAIGLSIHNASGDSGHKNAVIMMGRNSSNYSGQSARWSGRVGDDTTDFAIAVTAGTPTGVGHNKGESLTLSSYFHFIIDPTYNNKLMIGRLNRSGGDRFIVGTIRSIRVYSGHLSANQQLQNWLIDKKRFNL